MPSSRAGEDLAVEPRMSMARSMVLLVVLGPEHLVAGAQGGGVVGAVEGVGQGAVAVDLHDLDLGPGAGQALADQRIGVACPVGRGCVDDAC